MSPVSCMQINTLHRDIDYRQKGEFYFHFATCRVWEEKISDHHDNLNWFTWRRERINSLSAKLDPVVCCPHFYCLYMCKDGNVEKRRYILNINSESRCLGGKADALINYRSMGHRKAFLNMSHIITSHFFM